MATYRHHELAETAWDASIDQTLLAAHRPDDPIDVPITVIQADPGLGPAFMANHENRFRATNPQAEIIRYDGATHLIHAGIAHADRFLDELDGFVSTHAQP
ncbi:MAG: hypothetical protein P8N02_03810 [Actinomycetota bacterium]|jgi:hypothetical protein|nr:hypothetical protein [Actinomycetota bacterium]